MRRLLVVALVATMLYGCGGQNNQTSDNNKTNNSETANTSTETKKTGMNGANVVFINEDSLLVKYEFAKRIQKELTTKGQEVQADLASREQNFKNEVASYQRTAGTMTMNNVKATEQRLAVKQRDLQAYSRVRGKELAEEQAKLMKKLRDNVEGFLKRYCEENGYDFVLTERSVSSSILYGNKKLDVTNDVVKRLNKEYANGKTGDVKSDDKKEGSKEDQKEDSKTENKKDSSKTEK